MRIRKYWSLAGNAMLKSKKKKKDVEHFSDPCALNYSLAMYPPLLFIIENKMPYISKTYLEILEIEFGVFMLKLACCL